MPEGGAYGYWLLIEGRRASSEFRFSLLQSSTMSPNNEFEADKPLYIIN